MTSKMLYNIQKLSDRFYRPVVFKWRKREKGDENEGKVDKAETKKEKER